ncbi:MAG: ADP-ribosylglycohydrolase family protein [Candidatus Improbicoccus devescovinae]|nr:MAG: ADP-ribosylglycohydrolase family protein [Candidatus Improbicoccus devescovinae]
MAPNGLPLVYVEQFSKLSDVKKNKIIRELPLGAFIGDITGQRYERYSGILYGDFDLLDGRFTDDSILTCARMRAFSMNQNNPRFKEALIEVVRQFPDRKFGYGRNFYKRMFENGQDSNSFGNGAMMGVTAIGIGGRLNCSIDQVARWAENSTLYTHNHPDSKRGASMVAIAIYLARKNWDKNDIINYLIQNYELTCENFFKIQKEYTAKHRRGGGTDPSCKTAIRDVFSIIQQSTSFEDGLRKSVSLGNDADTTACIVCCILQFVWQNDPTLAELKKRAWSKLHVILQNYILEHYVHCMGGQLS